MSAATALLRREVESIENAIERHQENADTAQREFERRQQWIASAQVELIELRKTLADLENKP